MTQIMRFHSEQTPTHSFEIVAKEVMEGLQASLGLLIGGLPDAIHRAVDLERSLRIEKKLAWQAFRLSRSTNLNEMVNVPSLASVSRLTEAARVRGVSGAIVDQVHAAFRRFESLVVEQCGDRSGLTSMVSGLTHEKSESIEIRVRKAHFRSSAHLWGLQAQLQARTIIYCPSGSNGETLRGILVSGNIGLQSLRRGEPLAISSWMGPRPPELAQSSGTAAAESDLAIAMQSVTPGFELLPDFCSQPLPAMSHVPVGSSGMIETEMIIPHSGRSGALTLYLTQSAPTQGDARKVSAGAAMFISVPAAEVVTELMIPSGYSDPSTARVSVFGRRHHPERVFEKRRIDLLPQRENVSYFGPLEQPPPMEGAPRHHEAVRLVLSNAGLLGVRFDIYRCRVQYPMVHTLVDMRADPAVQSGGRRMQD